MRRQGFLQSRAVFAQLHHYRRSGSLGHLAGDCRCVDLWRHVPGEESYGHSGANRKYKIHLGHTKLRLPSNLTRRRLAAVAPNSQGTAKLLKFLRTGRAGQCGTLQCISMSGAQRFA